MSKLFQINDSLFLAENPWVLKNGFIGRELITGELPRYADIKDRLPRPIWDGHEDYIRCYDRTWELAFGNLRKADPKAGFVSDFIDTAFNGYLFMWDSSFIVMFGKYASRIFNFQQTLDNLYAHQHKDGFICREICETALGEQFQKDDPASTGPNVMPWCEWEYYETTGDKDRLSRVFYPLMAYHKWLQLNRSWPDGSYWSCGLACGMDNQPRQPEGYDVLVSHGFMSWIDACAQMYLSGVMLLRMAKELCLEEEAAWLREEAKMLYKTVNETMWSEQDGFYYDKRRDGSLSSVKSVGSYWTLLADMVPEERMDAFVAHLDNEKEFKRPNRIPSLAADTPGYNPENGGYWLGGVWAPTNYMTLKGLAAHGYDKLAYEIALDYLNAVVSVYNETGTVYENYSPEGARPGSAAPDFVGWTGLAPISVAFEYVLGIRPDAKERTVTWHINRLERHGIENYPFCDATMDLICEARTSAADKPVVHIRSDKPVTVRLIWNDQSEIYHCKTAY